MNPSHCFPCGAIKHFLVAFAALTFLGIFSTQPFAAVIRVPKDQPTISAAIAAAQSGDEIWVNGGTYKESVNLKSGVSLYGGFEGNETVRDQRQPQAHKAILDTQNAVRANSVTSATLDGFTITGSGSRESNTGISIQRCQNLRIAGCSIENTTCSAAVSVDDSAQGIVIEGLSIKQCYVRYTTLSLHQTLLQNCRVENNTCEIGLASFYNSRILNCIFAKNLSSHPQPAIVVSSSQIVNCTIFDTNQNGVGLNGRGCQVINTIIAGQAGWGISAESYLTVPPLIRKCLFFNNKGGNYQWSTLRFETVIGLNLYLGNEAQNVEGNPFFVNASSDDYRLGSGSNAAGRGTLEGTPINDIIGNPRPGGDGKVDIGAFETTSVIVPEDDFISPASYAEDLPTSSAGTSIPIKYRAADDRSGIDYLRLYYRKDNQAWTLVPDRVTTSPLAFNVTAAGGSGFYEFYTIAADKSGNMELPPEKADTSTTIIANFNGQRVYVALDGVEPRTGESWLHAFQDIDRAIVIANGFNLPEVWVKKGIYRQDVHMRSDVQLCGGFAGNETSFEQSNWQQNITIISGTPNNITGYSFTPVSLEDVDNVMLYGIHITDFGTTDPYKTCAKGININGSSRCAIRNCQILTSHGDYIYSTGISCTDSDIQIISCSAANSSIVINSSSMDLIDSVIFGNHGTALGIYNAGSNLAANVIRTKICGNETIQGGSIVRLEVGDIHFKNSIISANTCPSYACAIGISGYVGEGTKFENCIISGNSVRSMDADSTTTLSNCVIDSNKAATYDWYQFYGLGIVGFYNTWIINNSIFSNMPGVAIQDFYNEPEKRAIRNCLFFNVISASDHCITVNSLNMNFTGAGNNIKGDPLYAMDGPGGIRGKWSADGQYNAETNRTTLFESPGAFVPDSLALQILNPRTSETLQAFALSNTDYSVVVVGDYSHVRAGDDYKVINYHLLDQSAAVDRGDPAYAPLLDFDGTARPGTDGLVDIGAFEAPEKYQPPVDTIAPESMVRNLPDMVTTAILPVTYAASDAETGVKHVELFYMRNNHGWLQYGDTYTTSPIMFDTRKTGGDGYYQFISFATDNSGNREPWPVVADDATRVITSYSGKRLYVNAGNFLVGDGTSWAQAVRTINQALEVARKNSATEIWVAQGTYNEFITLGSNMHLVGGFIGVESGPEGRDPSMHKSIIDEGADEYDTWAGPVVTIADTVGALIDGFTIKGGIGKPTKSGFYYNSRLGGGIYCSNSKDCVISNCDIRDNQAAGGGGGIFIGNCAPIIEKCKIRFNTGGGFSSTNASPVVRDCIIESNTGDAGAGSIFGGMPIVENCMITMNEGTMMAAALRIYDSSSTIRNCTISNNTMYSGFSESGAIYTISLKKSRLLSISNCIISSSYGFGIVDSQSTSNTLRLSNNLFFGNTKGDLRFYYTSTYSTAGEINSSLPDAKGNIDANPRFIMDSPDGISGAWSIQKVRDSKTGLTAYTDQNASFAPNSLMDSYVVFSAKKYTGTKSAIITSNTQTTIYTRFNDDYYHYGDLGTTYTVCNFHVSSASPAIDAGVNIEGLIDDVNGNPRPVHGGSQARGDGSWYDIGADEFQFLIAPEYPAPQKPVNVSPADNSERISLAPVLEASAFALGGTHCMSDWQVAAGQDFSKLVLYSKQDAKNLTRIQVPSDVLKSNGLYSWRVRYRGSSFLWSEWSEPTSFRVAPAGVVRVPADHSTIQQAIDAAQEGAEVVVSPGTYFENLKTRGKNVSLRSTNPLDPGIVATTIIDGQSSGSVVTYVGTEDERSALEGFTILHGKTNEGGGGICGGKNRSIGYDTYPPDNKASIRHNVITANEALGGGGIAFINGPVSDNIITDNFAEFGGGLASCGGTISNNQITSNTANAGGGGIYGYTPGKKGIIEKNEISRNWALANNYYGYGYGGGGIMYYEGIIRNNYICCNTSLANGGGIDHSVGVNDGNVVGWNWASGSGGGYSECPDIRNSIIAVNKAREGGGVIGSRNLVNCTVYGNIARSNAGGVASNYPIINCILWGNEATSNPQGTMSAGNVTYSCIQNWPYGGTGNISLDPRFLDPAHGDYHLAPNSPCIDAGTSVSSVTTDWQGYARPFFGVNERRGDGLGFDMGASEFTIAVGRPAPYEYALDSLAPGKRVYGDADYVFADSIPAPLLGRTYIRTLNGDRAKAGSFSVTFKLWARATVWVAIDARVTKLPGWLADWQLTDLRLRTTDPNAERVLYRRDFQAGIITLGSNVPGESLDASMYTVIITPQDHVETRANEVWELY